MRIEQPPTIDPHAASRWRTQVPPASPWLHEEVARRMEQRLQWLVRAPRQWLHWGPLQGGLGAHALLRQRYPQATAYVVEESEPQLDAARQRLTLPWWRPARWRGPATVYTPAPPVDMVWANMALHTSADPVALMQRWHASLVVDGFLMFSCLGPDTLQQLRAVYASQGWPAPCHEFTDMHDWGDMLVEAGFAEPVMDMERITLSYSSPAALLQELRGLGRNLHRDRFAGLRGRNWYAGLQRCLQQGLSPAQTPQRLELTFEIIYGHAFKPAARMRVSAQSVIPLDAMRSALAQGRAPDGRSG